MEFSSTTNMRFLSSEGMSCEVQCGHIVVNEREKEQKSQGNNSHDCTQYMDYVILRKEDDQCGTM